MEVIKYIKEIPYGKTITYDDIARKIAKNKNIKRMSVQAVGGAFGRFLKLYLKKNILVKIQIIMMKTTVFQLNIMII